MSVNLKGPFNKNSFLRSIVSDSLKVKEKLLTPAMQKGIWGVVRVVLKTLAGGGTVFCAGNGGSAADANHFAAELSGKFEKASRRPLAAVSLAANPSVITAIANDFDFDEVFSRQLVGLGRAKDLLVCFSTSGNSKNLIKAAQLARKKKIKTLGLLGRDGGSLAKLCDVSLIIPSQSTPRIQEAHELVFHLVCHFIDLHYEG